MLAAVGCHPDDGLCSSNYAVYSIVWVTVMPVAVLDVNTKTVYMQTQANVC